MLCEVRLWCGSFPNCHTCDADCDRRRIWEANSKTNVNQKLLVTKGIATRSDRTLLGAPGLTTRNKKLLGTRMLLGWRPSLLVTCCSLCTFCEGLQVPQMRLRCLTPRPSFCGVFLMDIELFLEYFWKYKLLV